MPHFGDSKIVNFLIFRTHYIFSWYASSSGAAMEAMNGMISYSATSWIVKGSSLMIALTASSLSALAMITPRSGGSVCLRGGSFRDHSISAEI